MQIAEWMTLYGLAGIAAAVLAYFVAAAKGRDASAWAAWSFFLPPALLVLLVSGRGNPAVRAQRQIVRKLSALGDD